MKKAISFSYFLLLLIIPFCIACSSNGQQNPDVCDKHPEIRNNIAEYLARLDREQINGEKTVSSNGRVEKVQMKGSDLADSYAILLDLDIDLPSLVGRYGCESSVNGERRVDSFFALDSNLTTRFLALTFKDENLTFLEGKRKVGSVLARIHQHLEWDVKTGHFSIQVDYKNLFGREYFYKIEFHPGGLN